MRYSKWQSIGSRGRRELRVSRCSQAYMPHTKKDVKGFWLESLAERVWSGVQKRHLVKGVFERNNKIFEISEGVEEQDGAPVDP